MEAEGQRETQNSSSAPSSLVHSDGTILQAHINSLQQQLEVSHPLQTGKFKDFSAALLSAHTGSNATLIMFALSSAVFTCTVCSGFY